MAAQDFNRFAQPQTLVPIGNSRHINLNISGRRGPAVLLLGPTVWGTAHWALVQPRLAEMVPQVVSNDRPGFGFSDAGPLPRTVADDVYDLRCALRAHNIDPPYVVVGHSASGFDARHFANAHLDEVAGLVLIDPSFTKADRPRLEAADPRVSGNMERTVAELRERLAAVESGAGVDAPFIKAEVEAWAHMPSAVQDAMASWLANAATWRTRISTVLCRYIDRHADEFDACQRSWDDKPVLVLSAGVTSIQDAARLKWLRTFNEIHGELAAHSSRGVHRVIPEAQHDMVNFHPRIVVEAIHEAWSLCQT